MIKIIKTKKNKVLKIKIQNQILYIEAASINIYNILSSLAVLKILNFDFNKLTKFLKIKNHLMEEVKFIISKDMEKILN